MNSMYYANAKEAIHIRIVSRAQDISPHNTDYFKPLLAHQIFGDSEIVFGYRNLIIDIYYTASLANCFVDLKYTDTFKPGRDFEPTPDDIYEKLKPWLPQDFMTDKHEFIRVLKQERGHQGFGEQMDYFSIQKGSKDLKHFKITKCSLENDAFRAFHAHFQTFIVFYIDAANYIDLTDEKWTVYYVYEIGKRSICYPVGFCTVYNFYSYPDKIRPRISQFFVLPPYQRCGIGKRLLHAVYKQFQQQRDVKEFTVEKPNSTFTNMRNLVDCKLILTLPEFSIENVLSGYSCNMKHAAQQMYKFNGTQTAIIYKILLYRYTKGTSLQVVFEKHIKQHYYKNFKAKYNTAKRSLVSSEKLKQLREIVEGDFMTNKTIHSKYRQFIKEITSTVTALINYQMF